MKPKKYKWISITKLCNNNCLFCLDGNEKNRKHRPLKEIRQELEKDIKQNIEQNTRQDTKKETQKEIKQENKKLIISGGEPTIHPGYIEVIKLGKSLGYKKIQTITNGRMFSYKPFLDTTIKAGLNEITFSIHGHTKELHDDLTRSPGSFDQIIKAIKNAQNASLLSKSLFNKEIIINTDIVLNKKNIDQFPEIIKFLINLGIKEIDVLQVIPFGHAWTNKGIMLYNIEEKIDTIKKGFDIAIQNKVVLWTNRFPPEFLKGYEHLIQDPSKIIDELEQRKQYFEQLLEKDETPPCFNKRCRYCFLKLACQKIFVEKQTVINNNIDIEKIEGCLRQEIKRIKEKSGK